VPVLSIFILKQKEILMNMLYIYFKSQPMKPYIFLLLIICSLKSSYAQPSGHDTLVMSVERIVIYDKPVVESLQFKPGSFLKIKTINGKELRSTNYTFKDSAIVMITLMGNGIVNVDTIPLRNIVKIRGKVYGNADRKVAGTILALTGLPLLGFTMLAAGTSNNSIGTAMALLPLFAIPASGISLMGARSFNTKDKWTLKTTPSVKYQKQP
jgi:hypothetical protein